MRTENDRRIEQVEGGREGEGRKLVKRGLFYYLLYLSFRLSDFYEYVSDDEICKYVVDIVFLIDSSMSIKFNYREELYFVSRIAGR